MINLTKNQLKTALKIKNKKRSKKEKIKLIRIAQKLTNHFQHVDLRKEPKKWQVDRAVSFIKKFYQVLADDSRIILKKPAKRNRKIYAQQASLPTAFKIYPIRLENPQNTVKIVTRKGVKVLVEKSPTKSMTLPKRPDKGFYRPRKRRKFKAYIEYLSYYFTSTNFATVKRELKQFNSQAATFGRILSWQYITARGLTGRISLDIDSAIEFLRSLLNREKYDFQEDWFKGVKIAVMRTR